MQSTSEEWVHEPEAAKHLVIKQNTLRAMRRDRRLKPGIHWVYATGNVGSPVVYNLLAIRKTLAERTIAAVHKQETQQKAELENRLEVIETYSEEDHIQTQGA